MSETIRVFDKYNNQVLYTVRYPDRHWLPLLKAHLVKERKNPSLTLEDPVGFLLHDIQEERNIAEEVQPIHLIKWVEVEGEPIKLTANEAYWSALTLPMFTFLYLEWVSRDPKMVHLKHVCQIAERKWGKDWISWKNPEQHAGVSRFDRNFEL